MPAEARAASLLNDLRAAADPRYRADMAPRYGIVVADALGVPMAALQKIAKPLGRDQALAEALWETGVYDARMLASLIGEPARVTPELMDHWRAGFDNWAIVDTVCFKLFDHAPGAFARVEQWALLNDEFGRRAGFALLAALALHRTGSELELRRGLVLIEAASGDERNFVKKGVNWALRAIGQKGGGNLPTEARALAERLAASKDKTARWIGKDALRAFAKLDSPPA